METATLPAPKITAPMLEAATYQLTAVVVQDGTGAAYTLDRMSAAQADNPDITVLIDHAAALELVACAGGRMTAAARAATAILGQQYTRGLL